MKIFKLAVLTVLILTITSCTVNIYYPGSSIVDYATSDDETEKQAESAEDSTTVNETEETQFTEESEADNEPIASSGSIQLMSITSPISKNKTATVEIMGAPNTEYSISVFYATGKSTAKGLESKISSGAGNVSWSWKIGASLKPGSYKIIISGGGDTLETAIQVN